MSGLMDVLGSVLGEDTVRQIAGQLGADPAQVEDAIGMAIPAILGGLNNNAQTEEGAAALAKAVAEKHDGGIFDNLPQVIGNPQEQDDGGKILGHVLGGAQPRVEAGISRASGLPTGMVGSLMKMLAPIIMGSIGKAALSQILGKQAGGALGGMLGSVLGGAMGGQQQQQGGLGGLLGGLLGGGQQPQQQQGGLGGLLGGLLGGGQQQQQVPAGGLGGLASILPGLLGTATGQVQQQNSGLGSLVNIFLDKNHDGSITDDLIKGVGTQVLGGLFRK